MAVISARSKSSLIVKCVMPPEPKIATRRSLSHSLTTRCTSLPSSKQRHGRGWFGGKNVFVMIGSVGTTCSRITLRRMNANACGVPA